MVNNALLDTLVQSGVVAILRGTTPDEALHTVEAFAKAGLRGIEVTLNTPGATSIIAELVKHWPDLCIGAGTVLTVDDVARAADAGARFILSPDTSAEVIAATKSRGLVSVPGAFTATEILLARRAGADIVKIFPAGKAGPAYIKDLLGPLDALPFMPVGGVNLENTADFIRAGAVAVGVGGSLVNRELIAGGCWKALEKLAAAFLAEITKGRQA